MSFLFADSHDPGRLYKANQEELLRVNQEKACGVAHARPPPPVNSRSVGVSQIPGPWGVLSISGGCNSLVQGSNGAVEPSHSCMLDRGGDWEAHAEFARVVRNLSRSGRVIVSCAWCKRHRSFFLPPPKIPA